MFHFEKILWILVSLLLASCAQTSPRQERQPAKASAERFHQVALIQCKGCPQQPISFTQQSLDHSRVHFASALIRTPHDLVEHHARLKKKTSVFSSPVNFHKVVEYATASSLWVSMGFRFGYPPGGGKKYKKSANYRVLLAFPHSEEAFVDPYRSHGFGGYRSSDTVPSTAP